MAIARSVTCNKLLLSYKYTKYMIYDFDCIFYENNLHTCVIHRLKIPMQFRCIRLNNKGKVLPLKENEFRINQHKNIYVYQPLLIKKCRYGNVSVRPSTRSYAAHR